jgi:hypothetical protein
MDPTEIIRWEPILQSDVAVSLLLLAGLFGVATAQAVWIARLYRHNRELEKEFREHLKEQGHLGPLLEALREILALKGRKS